jgi:hypothetical protein
MPDKVSLRAIIEKRLEHFNIEISVISDALNFVVQSPAEVTTRFLQGVAHDSVVAGRPGFELQVEAYRNNRTLPDVRREMGLTLLADAILETKATPEECAAALRDLGQLPNGCEEVVRSIANQVRDIKDNSYPGEHMPVTQVGEHVHVTQIALAPRPARIEGQPQLERYAPPERPPPLVGGMPLAPPPTTGGVDRAVRQMASRSQSSSPAVEPPRQGYPAPP